MTPTLTRGWAPLRGVILGREKYIDLPVPELYDLADDPGESRNLVASKPDHAQVLANLLKQFDIGAATPRASGERRDAGAFALAWLYRRRTADVSERYTEADDPKRLDRARTDDESRSRGAAARRTDEAIALYPRSSTGVPTPRMRIASWRWCTGAQVGRARRSRRWSRP